MSPWLRRSLGSLYDERRLQGILADLAAIHDHSAMSICCQIDSWFGFPGLETDNVEALFWECARNL